MHCPFFYHMKELELLAPAGAYQTLKAIMAAGADAVYVGGRAFGARAFANNFTEEELLEAIDYVHVHDKKLYLTINTLLKDREIEEQLYDYLLPYYEQGLDAAIVQDFGVIQFLKEAFPKLAIHASTQMTITGADGAAFLLDQGVKRIVTARELSLEEIRIIKEKTGAEIESFVHGALCYCYSGQCLLSSMIGGRSGNRGRCAQPCRLPYDVLNDNGKYLTKEPSYVLSPKDLCTIQIIPQLAECGIDSFKIEGRMKQTEYAAGVTAIYRYYINRYQEYGKDVFEVKKEDYQKLLDLGNRSGFTDGYYKRHNGPEMITFEKPNHAKAETEAELQNDLQEKIKGKLKLCKGKHAKLTVSCLAFDAVAEGEIVQKAKSRPIDEQTVREKLMKTGNTPFVFENLKIEMEQDVFFPIGQLNALRRDALEQLKRVMLISHRRKEQGTVLPPSPKAVKDIEKTRCSVSLESANVLDIVCRADFVNRIYLESSMFFDYERIEQLKSVTQQIKETGKEAYLILPYIFREKTKVWYEENYLKLIQIPWLDGMMVRNYEELGFLKRHDYRGNICSDSNLYTYSNRAHEAFKTIGIVQDTLPLELNQKELQHKNCTESEMLIYGAIPLMISAGCVAKNFGHCKEGNERYLLKDRYGKEFSVKRDCDNCYNIIYNSQPLALFGMAKEVKKLCPYSYRLHFGEESPKEVKEILYIFNKIYIQNQQFDRNKLKTEYTNGHMKRGVE